MVVVQDLFLTETAELADVVLPGATWGEKTGCFTNADRTVHLSERAVDPPGEARPDLDIFLDYARRMDFRDRDGAPLIKWHDAAGAFEAWKACSKGRPCDYSGLSHERLRDAAGHPMAVHRGRARRHRAAVHRRRLQHRSRDRGDVRPGPRDRHARERARVPRQAAWRPRVPARRRLPPLARDARATSSRCSSPPAARSRTSTRAPRPPAPRSCRPPRPTSGSSSTARTPTPPGSPTATRSASAHRAARSRARRGSPTSAAGHVFVPFHYGYWDSDDDAGREPPTR